MIRSLESKFNFYVYLREVCCRVTASIQARLQAPSISLPLCRFGPLFQSAGVQLYDARKPTC
jgi:hypothetical protein